MKLQSPKTEILGKRFQKTYSKKIGEELAFYQVHNSFNCYIIAKLKKKRQLVYFIFTVKHLHIYTKIKSSIVPIEDRNIKLLGH